MLSDPAIGREVANRVLPADFAADKERLARLEPEAKAAGALNHLNIPAVHDVDVREYWRAVSRDGSCFFMVQAVEQPETNAIQVMQAIRPK